MSLESFERGKIFDVYDKDSEDMVSDEEFEYAGLVGRCASCSGLIACGFHHAGRIRFDMDEDDSM